jgi:hypothetical protein
VKKYRRRSKALAAAYKEGRLSLDAALKDHFRNINIGPVGDKVFFVTKLALGFANLGAMDKAVGWSNDRPLTVGQVIKDFKLRPFLQQP